MRTILNHAAALLLCALLFFTMVPGQAYGQGPELAAASAVLLDQASGRVLYGKDADQKRPIASITKVMTAILAIESGKMDQTVRVSANAVRTEGSSIYLKAGEKIKLRDLVYGLMLRSGNDASLAIAEAVGKSEQGFVFLMNEKAKEIGMTRTHFTNPNGLENPDHYSTAYDMALLTRYAMEQPTFRKIVQTRVYKAQATNQSDIRVWANKNKMLRLYKYATGGKTGFTKAAGRTLISTAKKGRIALIAVTLNDGDDWRDHQQLFEWGFSHFQSTQVACKGKLHAAVAPFYSNRLVLKRSLYLPLSADERRDLKKTLILVRPQKREGWQPPQPAGRLLVRLDQQTLANLPVYYQQQKKKKKRFWSLVQMSFGFLISGGEYRPYD
ncbi:MAG: D-alanyl-D-alanine carboxypeptidase family protein [Sporolactobacillus sp.]